MAICRTTLSCHACMRMNPVKIQAAARYARQSHTHIYCQAYACHCSKWGVRALSTPCLHEEDTGQTVLCAARKVRWKEQVLAFRLDAGVVKDVECSQVGGILRAPLAQMALHLETQHNKHMQSTHPLTDFTPQSHPNHTPIALSPSLFVLCPCCPCYNSQVKSFMLGSVCLTVATFNST